MAKERGLRSSNDAKPWKCRCGTVNHPKKRRFSDLPSWECRGCKREFRGSFKFCLGEIEVDGGSLIGEIWDQGKHPYCVAFAYGKGIEVVERVSSVNNGTDPNEVERINPFDLEQRFDEKFPGASSKDAISNDSGLHKVVHMGLILKEEGVARVSSHGKYQLEDLSTIPRDDFSAIMDCLAEGIPFLGTYLVGKRRSKLKYCQIYKSPPRSRYTQKRAQRKGHAVVLIGGGKNVEKKFFYCVNSWKKTFCPRKNTKGEIVKGGIGKIRACDLTKNVVKLSRPEKTDSCRRLEPQDTYDISNKNFILMMALKGQFTPMLRRSENVKSEKDGENVQCDDELFRKFREDHLVHGPFCDDEAEYPQNLEDRYEEMEENHMNEKLHRNKVKTTCSESGTGRTVDSRTVATDGGLRCVQAGRPVYQTRQQLQLNQSPSLSREASKALCQEKVHGKPLEEEELVFGHHYEDLPKSLEQARKLSLRKQEEASGSGPQSEAELATVNKGHGDADAAEGDAHPNKVISEIQELLWGLQLNEGMNG